MSLCLNIRNLYSKMPKTNKVNSYDVKINYRFQYHRYLQYLFISTECPPQYHTLYLIIVLDTCR